MRNFLISILVILILVLAFFFIRDGVDMGGFKVLGVYEIANLNNELDIKINEATDLTQVQFSSKEGELQSSLMTLSTEREKYEDVLSKTNKKYLQEALKKETYEIEKLWIVIGNYADEYGVKVNLQITAGTSGIQEVKDLNFTVNGSYGGITEFVYDLEDDTELEFKIENFKMVPDAANSNLKATFVVKDISVSLTELPKTNDATTVENDNELQNEVLDNTVSEDSEVTEENVVQEDNGNENNNDDNSNENNSNDEENNNINQETTNRVLTHERI